MKKILLATGLLATILCFGCSQHSGSSNTGASPATETSAGSATDAAKAYACPMQCEGEKTYPAPGSCPKCGMDLELVAATDKPAENADQHQH